MSLLLDLLKETYVIYKTMEDARPASYVNSFLPVSFLSMKAQILLDLYEAYFKLFTEQDCTPLQERALALAILELQYPGTDSNEPVNKANEAKEDTANKTKFIIITDILKTCANLEYGNINQETAKRGIEEKTPLFRKEFGNLVFKKELGHTVGLDYYLSKVKQFLRITPDLKDIKVMRQRFVDTEIECGQKTTKIAELETALQASKTELSEEEKTHQAELQAAQTKLSEAEKSYQATLQATQAKLRKVEKDFQELTEAQKQYDLEILSLKQIVYPTKATPIGPSMQQLQTQAKLQAKPGPAPGSVPLLNIRSPLHSSSPFGIKVPNPFSGNRNLINYTQTGVPTLAPSATATPTIHTTSALRRGGPGTDTK